MPSPISTKDETFKRDLSTYMNRTRAALKLIEEVAGNVDKFTHNEFMFELRKAMQHAEEAEAFAVRYAVRKIHAS